MHGRAYFPKKDADAVPVAASRQPVVTSPPTLERQQTRRRSKHSIGAEGRNKTNSDPNDRPSTTQMALSSRSHSLSIVPWHAIFNVVSGLVLLRAGYGALRALS